MSIDYSTHRLWDIKGFKKSSCTAEDLLESWSCPYCTFLNFSYTDTCNACSSVCTKRRNQIKQQQSITKNLADRTADLLFQRHDLLNDLEDDDDFVDDILESTSKNEIILVTKINYLLIAPILEGKQLHMLQLDLLIECLSFLGNPIDLMNLISTCKFFSFMPENDTIWWKFQSRFIDDPISSPLPSPPSSSSSIVSSQSQPSIVNSNLSPTVGTTWICSQCQLTQVHICTYI